VIHSRLLIRLKKIDRRTDVCVAEAPQDTHFSFRSNLLAFDTFATMHPFFVTPAIIDVSAKYGCLTIAYLRLKNGCLELGPVPASHQHTTHRQVVLAAVAGV
jgi:hypothetical protein